MGFVLSTYLTYPTGLDKAMVPLLDNLPHRHTPFARLPSRRSICGFFLTTVLHDDTILHRSLGFSIRAVHCTAIMINLLTCIEGKSKGRTAGTFDFFDDWITLSGPTGPLGRSEDDE